MVDNPRMFERVGDSQREQVRTLLSQACTEGYIDLVEYEHRIAAVVSARTIEDLSRQLADLPSQFWWDPRRPAALAPETSVQPSASASASASLALAVAAVGSSCCLGIGIFLGIPAVWLAWKSMKVDPSSTNNTAVAGLVVGAIGILTSLMFLAVTLYGWIAGESAAPIPSQ
ncbi:DUF1707 domain-containing protein [Catenuloplanes sp. NPDC051500]|uniref:DUF1707 domain-containing protein n=1 Tax=Catenuloplanes sp. NPDC051500 TaxID=3363959 RepID=UPI00379B1B94